MNRRSTQRRSPQHKQAGISGKPRALRIESIAAGGAGLARDDGRAVFVPRTAPGDLAEVTLESRGGALHGKLLRVVEPGPGRVEPICPFAEACGGCDLMHLTGRAQHEAHLEIVTSAFRHAGAAALPEIVTRHVYETPSGEADPSQLAPSGYRTRARFFARVERGKPLVGYRAGGSHSIAAIDRCAVLVPALDALLRELPELLRGATGDGEISVSLSETRPVVDIAWRGGLPAEVWSRLDQKTKAGVWAGARVWLDGATTPASFGDPRPVLAGADGRPLVIAAGGFAQPSEKAAIVLARHVANLVQKSGDSLSSIVELFAGSGTLSILLAPLAKRFVAVESVEPAVVCARKNLEARGLAGKVVLADASEHDPGHADVVVLDPPRTGARAAAQKIAASSTKAVVYVGCDPTTAARDAATLVAAGFTITDVEIVEIFPQTSHIETLIRLARRR
ncbi:MAG: class I SAM-dependent RNA methyltransferase [Polyangiaceae bacterium]